MGTAKISAGLLMFRRRGSSIEVLLAHPGGPFFRDKDAGSWTIPKGEPESEEDLRTRARIEFEEEVGLAPTATEWIDLGNIRQKGGKVVHAWAFEGDLPDGFKPRSNMFSLQWPPGCGKIQEFPEVDRVEFFPIETARLKIKPAQLPLIERLLDALDAKSTRTS